MIDWKNTKCGTCKWQRTSVICTGCNGFDKYIPMTNSMKIKLMSDEELAENNVREIFHDRWHCSDWSYFSKKENAIQHELEWLKSEVKE